MIATKSVPTFSYWKLLLFLALFAELLANDRPLVCTLEGELYFPAFRSILTDRNWARWQPSLNTLEQENAWNTAPYGFSIHPPIRYRPTFKDAKNFLKSPLDAQDVPHWRLWHYFGTDQSGGDVAAGIISGARVALLTAGTVLAISGALGVLLGGIAGYFGDRQLSVPRWRLVTIVLFLLLAVLLCFWLRLPILQYGDARQFWAVGLASFGLAALVFAAVLYFTRDSALWGKSITFPADFVIMRLIEVFDSVPKLILVTVVAALSAVNPSLYLMIAIIALFSWMGIATFVRGQLLQVRELKYLDAARVLGIPERKILLKHALPNAIKPAAIAFALSAGSAILLESSISFIGFTSDPNMVSWGKLLLEARIHPMAWWLAIFPGAMLSFTVYYLYKYGMRTRQG